MLWSDLIKSNSRNITRPMIMISNWKFCLSIFFTDVFFFKGREAVIGYYKLTKNSTNEHIRTVRSNLIHIFTEKFSLNSISYRVADELPAQLDVLGEKANLLQCLSSVFVLVHLYRRGRTTNIFNYWTSLSKDMNEVKKVSLKDFISIKVSVGSNHVLMV